MSLLYSDFSYLLAGWRHFISYLRCLSTEEASRELAVSISELKISFLWIINLILFFFLSRLRAGRRVQAKVCGHALGAFEDRGDGEGVGGDLVETQTWKSKLNEIKTASI